MTRNTDDPDWLLLRTEFAPELSLDENREFLRAFAEGSSAFAAFIASDGHRQSTGFAEVSVRTDLSRTRGLPRTA